jgi:hypothetical protein
VGARIVARMGSRLGRWITELRMPAPERRAARAERVVEERLSEERYPAVCIAELQRAAVEAEARKWAWFGEWR